MGDVRDDLLAAAEEWKRRATVAEQRYAKLSERMAWDKEAGTGLDALIGYVRRRMAEVAAEGGIYDNGFYCVDEAEQAFEVNAESFAEFAGRLDAAESALSAAGERARVDDEWMRAASEAVTGLTAGSLTGHPVVDAVAGLIQALSAAREEASARRADLAAAAGELLVPIPPPGTDAARLLTANVLMRRERDAAREKARRLTEALAEARRLREALRLIREFPIPEQDNMVAANMREVARAALGSSPENERTNR